MTDGGDEVSPECRESVWTLKSLVSGCDGLRKYDQGRCLRYPSLVSRKGLPLNAAISRARMDLHSAWRDIAKILNVLATAASRELVIVLMLSKRNGWTKLGLVNDA